MNNNLLYEENCGNIILIEERLTKSITSELKNKFMAFDVETTGFSCVNDRIIELGAVLFVNEIEEERFSSLVNPNRNIPPQVTMVNHITNQMIKKAECEMVVYQKFTTFFEQVLKGKIIVCAHNASFDMGFISKTLERLGYSGTIRFIDTLKIARNKLCLPNYKQPTVAEYFNIVNQNAHRACDDALTCGKILINLLK